MTEHGIGKGSQEQEAVKRKLDIIRTKLELTPFIPNANFISAEAQTELAFKAKLEPYESLEYQQADLVDVSSDSTVTVHLTLQLSPQNCPTILIIPSLIGSSSSPEVVRLGLSGFEKGFNIAAMNLRGQGDTEKLTKNIYHAGLTEDIHAVIKHLASVGLDKIFIAGFSLGGNATLKKVGGDHTDTKGYIKGAAVVSSAVDLAFNSTIIERSPHNKEILLALQIAARKMGRYHPEDGWGTKEEIRNISSIKEWDGRYIAGPKPKRWGFINTDDYYERASALPYIRNIRVPTLAIHAKDDTIASVMPLLGSEFTNNPNIITLITENGGHLGFVTEDNEHWANSRVIEFFDALRQ
ncbi:MAG: alpha/beta fold hydrolase [Patescibacteria group bacterium]